MAISVPHPTTLLTTLASAAVVAVVSVAFSLSFAALLFSGDLAEAYPVGLACILVSALVTGLVTAVFSSLPFTIAGPEASVIAILGTALAPLAGQVAEDRLVATTLLAVVIASLIAGVVLGVLGLARVGRLVRFVPFPVIAGFLAAAGWFLVTGGLQVAIDAPRLRAVLTTDRLPNLAAAILAGTTLLVLLPRIRAPIALPAMILGGVALHHAVAGLLGIDPGLQRALGWLPTLPGALSLPRPWAPETLALVDWRALAGHLGDLPLLILVAALGLLLNISGLETMSGRDADFDRDLRVAGGAALAAGLAGGLLGSGSVSRSILLFRTGGGNRWGAAAAALIAGGAPMFQPDILGLVPRWVLGGLLIYLGLSVLRQWVVQARGHLPFAEWLQVLAVVGIIIAFGFLVGLIAGLLLACGHFLARYGSASPLRARYDGTAAESHRARPEADRAALRASGATRLVLHLQGYLFFGTAHRLLEMLRPELDGVPRRSHLLLDFREVVGLDSSATRTFNRLADIARARGVTLVLTGLTPSVTANLGVLATDPGTRRLPTLQAGLEWLEDAALAALPPRQAPASFLERIAETMGEADAVRFLAALPVEDVPPGARLMVQGENSDDIVLLEAGVVVIQIRYAEGHVIEVRVEGPGSLLGELGFLLGTRRSATITTETACRLRRLSRSALARLEQEHPDLGIWFHRLMAQLLAGRIQDKDRQIQGLVRAMRQPVA